MPHPNCYNASMNLQGTNISNGDGVAVLEVIAGDITEIHPDRRRAQGEIRVGSAARRRKPPPAVAHLVGTSQLWVAAGYVVVHHSDTQGVRATGGLRLHYQDLLFHVASLRPRHIDQQPRDTKLVSWEFRALFVPSIDSLVRWGVVSDLPSSPGTDKNTTEREAFESFLSELSRG
jgi:hypothetical protein